MRTVYVALVLLLVTGCGVTVERSGRDEPALLQPAGGGDGDSWKDTDGREYRLGLVNAPELNECFGRAASDRRKGLVRRGFQADVYERDRFGRSVAEVTLPDGRSLNVELARTGYADDRFLAKHRRENPELAERLDQAFAEAKRERRGLWRACR